MAERSPMPWFVHDFADPAVSSDPSPADVTVSCDHPATITVASMGRGMTATLDEARANAAFIVHAVNLHYELVAALRMVANQYEILDMPKYVVNAVDAALSKSTPPQEGE